MYLVGRRDENFPKRSRDGGAATAPPYVLRNDSSKGERF